MALLEHFHGQEGALCTTIHVFLRLPELSNLQALAQINLIKDRAEYYPRNSWRQLCRMPENEISCILLTAEYSGRLTDEIGSRLRNAFSESG